MQTFLYYIYILNETQQYFNIFKNETQQYFNTANFYLCVTVDVVLSPIFVTSG